MVKHLARESTPAPVFNLSPSSSRKSLTILFVSISLVFTISCTHSLVITDGSIGTVPIPDPTSQDVKFPDVGKGISIPTFKRIPQAPVYFAFNSVEPLLPLSLKRSGDIAQERGCSAVIKAGVCSCGAEGANEKVMTLRGEAVLEYFRDVEVEMGFLGIGQGKGKKGHALDRRVEVTLTCPE